MKKMHDWVMGLLFLGLCLGAGLLLAGPLQAAELDAADARSLEATTFSHDFYMAPGFAAAQAVEACDVTAVDLIGAWVDAGAVKGSFPFASLDGEDCTGDFTADVLPLFTEEDIWFEGSQACTECHFDNSEDSRHEMDLSSHAGIMLGGDVLSDPPGVAIVVPGDWSASKLRARLRDNRMPPGWEFDIEETNRDGPAVTVDGVEITAVDLIGAWADAGAPEEGFTWLDADGAEHSASFADDVLPFFTEEDIWFEGSQACTECHFDNSEDSRHEMDLSSHAGLMLGGDVLSDPPGVAIVMPGDWSASKLRARLRDNRMPPGWEFDIEETNRDGPVLAAGVKNTAVATDGCEIYAVDLIGAWVDAGAPEGDFSFADVNGDACAGDFNADVLPLFTEEDIWFEGSQACTECHFDNSEDSRHEMDLSSHAGIMLGGDVLSDPPGVAIVVPGDWSDSKLRARLRDNRMPPDWEFDIEETNRDGPAVTVDGVEITAVDLIGAWADAGAPEEGFTWLDADGAEHNASFADDVLPFFTEEDIWFEGSQACTECHFDNSEDSRHEMDLSSHAGLMLGGDVLSDPPGVAIVMPGDWSGSKLRARLRDNRMPPGWEFDIEETNRDGPLLIAGVKSTAMTTGACEIYAVDLIGAWVDAGAPEGTFSFTAVNGDECGGDFVDDVLPFFTEEDIWFEGSQACTECHFDNSEDSRHEMDLSSHAGLMLGGDVLSDPPGVAIVVPGDWSASKLRARLRDNRMPPGWEFDIEETNRDGPAVTVDGVEITAVDLIGAWADAGAPEEGFTWLDADGAEHSASFADDVLPFFTEEDIWFEGSQACTECHFDNSEDSRHEMDLSSHAGLMLGGDVLSDPPGVAIVMPGDWSASKLRARLRDNRMPPGWEFDIEETNRDGPLVMVGMIGESGAEVTAVEETAVEEPAAVAESDDAPDVIAVAAVESPPPPPPEIPEGTITETVTSSGFEPMALGLLGIITLVFGVIMVVMLINRLRDKSRQPGSVMLVADVSLMLFTLFAMTTGGVSLHAVLTDTFTQTRTIHEKVPFVVEIAPEIPQVPEVRVEDWQARIPESYADLENPFAPDDAGALATGQLLYEANDCYNCHGEDLEGHGDLSPALIPRPVDLTDPVLMSLPFMTDQYLFWRISEGGAQSPFFSAMPAWRYLLDETQRWQLVTYIRSQTADSAVDDGRQAAIAVIEQFGCFACHRSEEIGRGGKIGPGWDELSEVAGSRVEGLSAEEYVLQSIVEPQVHIVPGFEDQANTMPPDFGDRLTVEEQNLLVSFLLQLDDE